MFEVTTTARLADYRTLAGEESVTAVLDRTALQAAAGADSPAIWLDVGHDDADVSRVTLTLTSADIEELLRSTEGDVVTVAVGADAVADLLDDPEVEAHGMRGAIAVAVVAGAIAAPAGLAATPQVSLAGTSAQAAKSQVSRASVESQVTRAGARAQVSRASVESQVVRAAAKRQLAKSLVVKASGVKVLGIAR